MPKVTTAELTKSYIAAIKPSGERMTFRDSKCQGLILRVGATGRKTWAYDYRDPRGKRQTFTLGTVEQVDPGQARLALNKLRGTDPAGDERQVKLDAEKAEARTLRVFLEGKYWNDYLKHARSGLATKKRILSAWAPLLDADMATLEVQDAIEHRNDRRDEGVSPQTLNRDRIALLAMVNKAREWKLIAANPLDDPAFKPLKTEDDRRVRWLGQRDDQEDVRDQAGRKVGERARFAAALEHADTPVYLRQLCILAQNTGLRRGELFKLKWSSVSIRRSELVVTAATAKSAKTRHVPLNAAARAVLEEVDNVRHVSGYVFVNTETGAPFTTLKKSWAALAQRAQLEDFTFHDLRHDFASRLVQAGVNLYEVKDLLGHSTITLTERYAHLAPHQKRAAVALLEASA
jgi:integrase